MHIALKFKNRLHIHSVLEKIKNSGHEKDLHNFMGTCTSSKPEQQK